MGVGIKFTWAEVLYSVPRTFNCAETIRLIGRACGFDSERMPVSIAMKLFRYFYEAPSNVFSSLFSPFRCSVPQINNQKNIVQPGLSKSHG